jgi:hypothetical protein
MDASLQLVQGLGAASLDVRRIGLLPPSHWRVLMVPPCVCARAPPPSLGPPEYGPCWRRTDAPTRTPTPPLVGAPTGRLPPGIWPATPERCGLCVASSLGNGSQHPRRRRPGMWGCMKRLSPGRFTGWPTAPDARKAFAPPMAKVSKHGKNLDEGLRLCYHCCPPWTKGLYSWGDILGKQDPL